MNHLTSRSALAMALAVPLVLPVPALAFEASGNDIADRFMEIMEAGNATVTGYDSVAESGDTVTITGLATTINEGDDAAKLSIASTAITGGQLADDGGLSAGALAMTQVRVDGKDKGDDIAITVETITIADPVLPSAASVGKAAAGTVAPGYSRAELSDILIDAGDQGRIPVERVVARIDRMDGDLPTSGSVDLEGIRISQDMLDDDEKETLAELGYEELTLSAGFSGDWDPASGRLDVTRLTMGGDTSATIDASLVLGGLTREVVEKLDQSQEDPQQAMALMQGLTLERMTLRIDNASLVDRLLDSQAKSSGMSRADFVAQLSGALPMMLSVLNNADFQTKVAAAGTTFLNEPKSLSAVASPANPLPLAQVMGTAMMAPQMLPDILNVTIAANEPKADQ
uniref:hypothetical protein n=1 Tax=Stappia sp. TaxID=1870903 RepID=UPI003BA9679F